MTSGASNFLLNIVELQNVQTSASGLSPVAALSNTVAQLQQMVNYDQKRIYVNTISQFNTTPIQFLDSVNFASNTSLTLNGAAVGAGSSSGGATSSIGYISSFTNYFNPSTLTDTAIEFQVGDPALRPLTVTAGGTTTITGDLVLAIPSTPALGYYLTCMDGLGTAEWLPPGAPSDARLKQGVRGLENAFSTLQDIQGVRFQWIDTGRGDIGFVAQNLQPVLPEAVYDYGEDKHLMVQYHKVVPLLVEAVKELGGRVSTLDARIETLEAAAGARARP
jgi:hypothetical protein